jgi:dipeptidyl aminopeptidase/acylaminoacyl peptidase
MGLGEIVGSAWDPDGELLALTLAEPGRADRVAVFDPTGEEVAQLQAEPPTAFGEIAFSRDGRRLLVPRLASEASDTETRGVDVLGLAPRRGGGHHQDASRLQR